MALPPPALYPEISPYRHDLLELDSGHQIYFEECGNPEGAPVVFLHGGPGSGCSPTQRRFFDPTHYRIVLFDQRGCGRSLPTGETRSNTTGHLVDDIEVLRKHLGITRWLVFGGSWGSTLALAYASTHPDVVSGLILRGIFLGRDTEVRWFVDHVQHFYPEAMQRLLAPLNTAEQQDIVSAYYRRVFAGDVASAQRWNAFESSIMTLLPAAPSTTQDDAQALARARVQLHYLVNQCFLSHAPLIERVNRIRSIPAIIIQGRYDMVCPPISAWELHQAWPEAEFVVVPDAGHAAMEPGTLAALLAATEHFKSIG